MSEWPLGITYDPDPTSEPLRMDAGSVVRILSEDGVAQYTVTDEPIKHEDGSVSYRLDPS